MFHFGSIWIRFSSNPIWTCEDVHTFHDHHFVSEKVLIGNEIGIRWFDDDILPNEDVWWCLYSQPWFSSVCCE